MLLPSLAAVGVVSPTCQGWLAPCGTVSPSGYFLQTQDSQKDFPIVFHSCAFSDAFVLSRRKTAIRCCVLDSQHYIVPLTVHTRSDDSHGLWRMAKTKYLLQLNKIANGRRRASSRGPYTRGNRRDVFPSIPGYTYGCIPLN